MPTKPNPEPGHPEVEKYYASAPPESRTTLQELRGIVRAAASGASEVIGYQMPTFRYEGGLVAIGGWKTYCSLYVMSNAVLDTFAAELQPFMAAKSTLHFQNGEPLPRDLVTRLVQARVAENETSAAARNAKPARQTGRGNR
jgi:uncharacterized protein YdhG (YjbR/CyaY superfamily)